MCIRDSYQHCLFNFPELEKGPYRKKWDLFPWQNNHEWFTRWSDGQTGVPIIDAAMRQLNSSGWMHNRCRMIVASFLVKDLICNWQINWSNNFSAANSPGLQGHNSTPPKFIFFWNRSNIKLDVSIFFFSLIAISKSFKLPILFKLFSNLINWFSTLSSCKMDHKQNMVYYFQWKFEKALLISDPIIL